MRVLLDEMLDRRLRRSLPQDMEAVTVRERGWGSKENGELLGLAQEEFDALLTTDQSIPDQQNLSRFDLTVVVLEAKSNDIEDLEPLMDQAVEALRAARRSHPRDGLIRRLTKAYFGLGGRGAHGLFGCARPTGQAKIGTSREECQPSRSPPPPMLPSLNSTRLAGPGDGRCRETGGSSAPHFGAVDGIVSSWAAR